LDRIDSALEGVFAELQWEFRKWPSLQTKLKCGPTQSPWTKLKGG
jgi:hypothetical protein